MMTDSATPTRHTPIHAWHLESGGLMVPFAGFEMPVRYGRITEEHLHVRRAVGLFDVSHMGELRLSGPEALEVANRLFTNDLRRGLPRDGSGEGRALYGAILNDRGGILDDVIAYAFSSSDVLFCVNASNLGKIRSWFAERAAGAATLSDESAGTGQIAVQGPRAPDLLARLCPDFDPGTRAMRFLRTHISGTPVVVATTGYTGERGGEIFAPAERTLDLWEHLLALGASLDVRPIGLGARDTLRLEKGFCLYGNDIDEHTTPLQAGIGWTVRFDKVDFIGLHALSAEKERGPDPHLVGLRMKERGIPRAGYPVQTAAGEGRITSGTFSPSLREAIAMAYVPAQIDRGAPVQVRVHGSWREAEVVPLPFL